MNYRDFAARLSDEKKALSRVFILAGGESYLIGAAEKLILARLLPDAAERAEAVEVMDGDAAVADIIAQLTALPFFSERRVVIVRQSKIFGEKKTAKDDNAAPKENSTSTKQAALDELAAVLADMPETNYVIFESSWKADKRRKITKAAADWALFLDADPVRPYQIEPWIDRELARIGRRLDPEARRYLLSALANLYEVPLGFIAGEMDKLALYTEEKTITREILAASIAGVPELSGFALVDAVDAHDTRRALRLLSDEIAAGVYAPVLLALIVNHVRQLWLARALLRQGLAGRALTEAMGATGKSGFIMEKLVNAAKTFDEKVLHDVFLLLCDADYQLKTGRGGLEMLEAALIKLGPRSRR